MVKRSLPQLGLAVGAPLVGADEVSAFVGVDVVGDSEKHL